MRSGGIYSLTMCDRQRMNMIQSLKKAQGILNESNFSIKGADTSQVPFFINSIDKDITIDDLDRETTPEYRGQIREFANLWKFPLLIRNLYLMLGSTDREFVFRGFTFFSFKKILERQKEYCKHNNDNICDLALSYDGMGWVYVLALDTVSGKYFVRSDGGSNDYDRQFNWEYYRNYVPSSKPDTLITEQEFFNPNTPEPYSVPQEKLVRTP